MVVFYHCKAVLGWYVWGWIQINGCKNLRFIFTVTFLIQVNYCRYLFSTFTPLIRRATFSIRQWLWQTNSHINCSSSNVQPGGKYMYRKLNIFEKIKNFSTSKATLSYRITHSWIFVFVWYIYAEIYWTYSVYLVFSLTWYDHPSHPVCQSKSSLPTLNFTLHTPSQPTLPLPIVAK